MAEYYIIQDNESKPFQVSIDGSKIKIHCLTGRNAGGLLEFKELLLEYNRKDVIRWVGNSPLDYRDNTGNSLLFQMDSDKYIFIGKGIFQFTLGGDTITDFISPDLGYTSYPIAIGIHNTYFFAICYNFGETKDHLRYIDSKILETETGITLGPDTSDEMAGPLYDYYYKEERLFLDGDESQIHSIEGTTIIPWIKNPG